MVDLKFPLMVFTLSVLGGVYLYQVFQASNKSPFRTPLESFVPSGLLILFLAPLLYHANAWDGNIFRYGGKNNRGNEPLEEGKVRENLKIYNKDEMGGDSVKNPEFMNEPSVPSQMNVNDSEKPSADKNSRLSRLLPLPTIPEGQPSTPAEEPSIGAQQTANSNGESAWVNIPTRTRTAKPKLPRNIIWKNDIKKALRKEGVHLDSECHSARRGRAERVDRFDDDDERPRTSKHGSREEPSEESIRRARWDLGV
ncbi:hypothetical protein BS50DRAFT_594567 [Corynespora cassiicola Philippines]|uniref:Uncharacterized protein n=1 Tax=Corynespora cassiicola Philippines TaxID=1448308 RepID=A0A2T2N260_CORCC|nr:hypothetical protein BS50DRAFT_594567 [Corynespora cassiicola Philippines]